MNNNQNISTIKNEKLRKLFELAHLSKTFSYSPYSKFRVGCCIKTKNNKYFQGCNVENSSYGLSICAERTAIVKAISEGEKEFDCIAITTDVKEEFVSPCGACRQFMSEFGNFDIYLVKPDNTFKKTTILELLPDIFTSNHLLLDKINSE